MDAFLVLDSHFINVEVNENQNFNCIICKRVFLTRKERNDCIETHLLHINCKNCMKPVIVIGGLELELHRPTNCAQIESAQDDLFVDAVMNNENDDEFTIENDKIKILVENISNNESCEELIQNKIKVENSIEIKNEVNDETKEKNKKSAQKVKRKSARNLTRSRKNKTGRLDNKDAESNTEQSDSEDDVFKKKVPRKKLPKILPCTLCMERFGTERYLKIHMKKKHGFKERFICSICDREFKVSGNLKQHMETHTDFHRFICSYCGKGFHLPFNMKQHMNSHTGVRPYKCETCGKFFGRTNLLSAHMRIHTGEKPYKCNVDDCDRAYAYKTDLKRHQRAVHKIIDKTFPCRICGKIFYENKFLTKHLKVH